MNASSASPTVLAFVSRCLPCFRPPRPLADSLRASTAKMLTNADQSIDKRVLIRRCCQWLFESVTELCLGLSILKLTLASVCLRPSIRHSNSRVATCFLLHCCEREWRPKQRAFR